MKAGIDFDGNRESALFFDSEVVEGSDETDVRGGGSSQSLENPDEVFVGVHFCEFARSDDRVDDGSPPSSGRVSQEQPVFATYCRGPYPRSTGLLSMRTCPLFGRVNSSSWGQRSSMYDAARPVALAGRAWAKVC